MRGKALEGFTFINLRKGIVWTFGTCYGTERNYFYENSFILYDGEKCSVARSEIYTLSWSEDVYNHTQNTPSKYLMFKEGV